MNRVLQKLLTSDWRKFIVVYLTLAQGPLSSEGKTIFAGYLKFFSVYLKFSGEPHVNALFAF